MPEKLIGELLDLPERVRKGDFVLNLSKGVTEPDKTLAGVAKFLSDPKRPVESTLLAMMRTPHLGEAGPHPVGARAAREAVVSVARATRPRPRGRGALRRVRRGRLRVGTIECGAL